MVQLIPIYLNFKEVYKQRTHKHNLIVFILLNSLMISSGALAFEREVKEIQPYNGNANREESIEGNEGVLHVYGVLTESACRLDMESVNQVIDMGETSTGSLLNVGDEGTPVAVKLTLRDCLRSTSYGTDQLQGNMVWSENQPSMSATFVAPNDIWERKMIKVKGAQGIALRLSDNRHKIVPLGEKGRPVLLNPGTNVLHYWLTPVRTAAPLRAGAYNAHVDFRLSYD